MTKVVKVSFFVLLVAACFSAALIGRLLWLPYHYGGHLQYESIAELLSSFVIAVSVSFAVWEFTDKQRGARASANVTVFNLYKMYLSPEYHDKIRRPAWFSVSKAKRDSAYRCLLLAGLAAEFEGDEVAQCYERRRAGMKELPGDRGIWLIHDEYHRVQDIFGFFTTLSLLDADEETMRLCGFFYDSWSAQLRWIVRELGEHIASSPTCANANDEEKRRIRHTKLKETLDRLDEKFAIKNKPSPTPTTATPNALIP